MGISIRGMKEAIKGLEHIGPRSYGFNPECPHCEALHNYIEQERKDDKQAQAQISSETT